MKTDSNGNMQWETAIGDGLDRFTQTYDISQAGNGRYQIVGTSTAIQGWDQRIIFITLKPDLHVVINDKYLVLDTLPYIKNGRAMVPLRGIFEALGAKVEWDGKTNTVTALKDDTTIVLRVGSATAYKNGVAVNLDQPAEIVNGRTMVPLRFIGESLGAEVEWDSDNRAVVIKEIDN